MPSLPALREDGFVLGGPRSGSRPLRSSISLLLCELNAPPLPSLSCLWDVVFILWVILLLWLCLVDLPSSAPSSACFHLSPDHACIGAQDKPVQEAEQAENEEFVLFSPSCSLPLWLFWNWGSSGARLHPAGRDLQPPATRVRV